MAVSSEGALRLRCSASSVACASEFKPFSLDTQGMLSSRFFLCVCLVKSASGFASMPGRAAPVARRYDPYDQLPAAPSFELTSETVTDGVTLAAPQLSAAFGVPDGEDVSPDLAWTGAPAGTKSYVVTCYDPDAPTVSGFWHWAMYDIPANVTSLPLNAGNRTGAGMPAGAKMLLNDASFAGFVGAAPPEGHGDHRYMFVVSALGVDSLPIEASTSPSVMSFNMFGAGVLGRARLTATFGR